MGTSQQQPKRIAVTNQRLPQLDMFAAQAESLAIITPDSFGSLPGYVSAPQAIQLLFAAAIPKQLRAFQAPIPSKVRIKDGKPIGLSRLVAYGDPARPSFKRLLVPLPKENSKHVIFLVRCALRLAQHIFTRIRHNNLRYALIPRSRSPLVNRPEVRLRIYLQGGERSLETSLVKNGRGRYDLLLIEKEGLLEEKWLHQLQKIYESARNKRFAEENEDLLREFASILASLTPPNLRFTRSELLNAYRNLLVVTRRTRLSERDFDRFVWRAPYLINLRLGPGSGRQRHFRARDAEQIIDAAKAQYFVGINTKSSVSA